MVTKNAPQIASGQAIFEWKCMFSQIFSTMKVKIVDKMMQNAYLRVILHVKHKKLPVLAVFNLISNSW